MSWLKDVRFAARTVLRYPWTHGAAAFILSVSLGAVLCTLSILDEILWSPLPHIERPERVAWLFGARGERGVDENRDDSIPLGNAVHFGERSQSLAQVGWFAPRKRVLLGSAEPEVLSGFGVSGKFFSLLGAGPRLGRLLTPADMERGARPVVVLGEGFWRQRFAADPALLGRPLNLDGVEHTVVGITPEGFFAQIGAPAQLWLPYPVDAGEVQDRSHSVPTLARLADGATLEAANAELGRLSQAIAEAHPHTDRGLSTRAVPLPNVLMRFRPLAFALVLAATFVLTVAGAVAANLLLAQATERSRELAVRQALGASRAAILGQWCVQVGVLMAIAVGLGTLLGQWGIDATLGSMPGSLKRSFGTPEAALSWRSWWSTVGIAGAATPLIGLVPARHASRSAIGRTLRDGGGGTLGKASGGRMRRLLVGLQLALASALTFGAACAYLGFVAAREEPLGFEPEGVTQLTLPNVGADPAQRALLLSRLQLGAAQGSLQLAQASDALLTRQHEPLGFHEEGTPRPSAEALPWGKSNRVSPDYFAVLGIPLLVGRAFRTSDDVNAPCVVVLSERLARSSFGEPEAAVGRRLYVDLARGAVPVAAQGGALPAAASTTCEVVGVAGEVRDVLPGSPGNLYLASGQWPPGDILYVRGATAAELARLKAQIQSLDPRQAVWEEPLTETVASSTWGWRILAAMFLVLALVGSSLAGVGTYAVLAHSATLRRRELGLRAVLGADPRELAWLVVAENLLAGVLGIVVGVSLVAAGVLAVARFQPGLWLYPIAAALMACLLGGAALLSARRVLALEPGVALRRR